MFKVILLGLAAIVFTFTSASVLKPKSQEAKAIRGQIVFLGDSITDWFDSEGLTTWNQFYAPLGAVNTGVAGDRTQTIIDRIGQGMIDNLHSYLAVLKIGTNDLSGSVPVDQIAANIRTIIGLIQAKNPGIHILLLGVLPRGGAEIGQRIQQVNALISQYQDGNTIFYLDMEAQFSTGVGVVIPDLYWDDQLHLSQKGYVVWAESMNPLFYNVLNAPFDGKAVFLGDSITQGWGGAGHDVWNLNYAPIRSNNEGISGHNTGQTIDRIVNGKVLDNINAKVAVVKIGTNDLSQGVSETQIAANIGIILDLIRERLPHVRILLLGVLPRGGVEIDQRVMNVNNLIARYDNGFDVTFLDMRPQFQVSLGNPIPDLYTGDLLHLSTQGYQRWHETMWPYFQERIQF